MKNKIGALLVVMILAANITPLVSHAESAPPRLAVMVTAPVVNESLVINKNFTIKWSGDKKAEYSVILEDAYGSKVGIIKESTKGNSFKWRVGKIKIQNVENYGTETGNAETDVSYRIRVVDNATGPVVGDQASDLFVISPQPSKVKASASKIQIISPNGGEIFTNTGRMDFSWTIPTDKAYSTQLFLMPSDDTLFTLTNPEKGIRGWNIGGSGQKTPVQSSIQGGPWSVGAITDGKYKLRAYLYKYNNSGKYKTSNALSYDESDGYFTIATQPPASSPVTYQSQVADAKTKATLSSLRAYAELYYDKASSYKGFCSSSSYFNSIVTIQDQSHTPICYDYAASYAISFPLQSETSIWCVDSTGKSSKGIAVSGGNNAKCSL